MLIHLLVTLGCISIDIALNTWFDITYSILSFIPTISAVIRRLHDIHKSGYWGLAFLVPIIGPFILLYWLLQPSNLQTNKKALV